MIIINIYICYFEGRSDRTIEGQGHFKITEGRRDYVIRIMMLVSEKEVTWSFS